MFFSVGFGSFRIGTSSGGILNGFTGEGLVWLLLFAFIGMPIFELLFESFFFIVFVLLFSSVLVATTFAIFELAIRKKSEKGISVEGASSILTPFGGVVLGIPTAAIYLLCLYRMPLVGRDWDYSNRIENCPKFGNADLCEFTEIYGFANISKWIIALGGCTAYIVTAFVVGFALRKKWLPIAELAWYVRQYQAWEALGRKSPNPFKGGAAIWLQSATRRSLSSRTQSATHQEPDAEETRRWLQDNPSGVAEKTTPLWKRIQMAYRRRNIRRREGIPQWSDYPDWAGHPRPTTHWRERNRLRKIRDAKERAGELLALDDYPSYKSYPRHK
jgi:hypothetical protein